MLAIKNPSSLQEQNLQILNEELKWVKLPQEVVDSLIWLTSKETSTIESIACLARTLKNQEALPCGHHSEDGIEKQYSSKDL